MSYDEPLSSEEARSWALAEMKLSQPAEHAKWKPWFAWYPIKVEGTTAWQKKGLRRWCRVVERAWWWEGIGRGWGRVYRDPGVWTWWDQNEKERREWEAAGCPH